MALGNEYERELFTDGFLAAGGRKAEAPAAFARWLEGADPADTSARDEGIVRDAIVEKLVKEGRSKHRVLNDDQQAAADDEARAFYRKVIDRFRDALAAAPETIHDPR